MSNHIRGKHRKAFVLGGGGSGEPLPGCQPVTILTNSLPAPVVGQFYSQYIFALGTPPLVWDRIDGVFPTGLALNTDTGLISGTPTDNTPQTFTIEVQNSCPSDDRKIYTLAPAVMMYTVRWGNFVWPEGPLPAPTFTESDFTGGNPDYLDGQTSTTSTIAGMYYFPFREGCHNIMWVDDAIAVGFPQFNTGGDPWSLYPAQHTPLQTLTINGRSGKVYYSTFQNADFAVTVTI